jgi:hypothetical protein
MPRYVKGQRQPGQGGRRSPPGGRPTREQAEIKKEAAEIKKEAAQIAKEFIETHVQGFLDSYLDLGTGKVIERLDKDGNVVKLVMIDPATVRHAIDKILPDEQMQHAQPLQFIFQDFARAAPPQLPAQELSALTGYGNHPDRANDLTAPAEPCQLPPPILAPEGKIKIEQIKFYDFSRKRRQ